MAILAKSSGLMVSVILIEETDTFWYVKAIDEKKPKLVQKSDGRSKVFHGDFSIDSVLDWIETTRQA